MGFIISRIITIARNYSLVFCSLLKENLQGFSYHFFLHCSIFKIPFVSLLFRATLILYHILFRLSSLFFKTFSNFFENSFLTFESATFLLYHTIFNLSSAFPKNFLCFPLQYSPSLTALLLYHLFLPLSTAFDTFGGFDILYPIFFHTRELMHKKSKNTLYYQSSSSVLLPLSCSSIPSADSFLIK